MSSSSKPVVVIYGCGLVGSYLACHLLASGKVDVHLIARPSYVKRIQAAKYLKSSNFYHSQTHEFEHSSLHLYTKFSDLPKHVQHPELLILTMKRQDIDAALQDCRQLVTREAKTMVVAFGNGVRIEEQVQQVLPNVPVTEGMWPFNVIEVEPGHFHQGSLGTCYLTSTDQGIQLAKWLTKAGLACNVAPKEDMVSYLYGKLLFNLNNPINALSGIPLRKELSNQGFRRILSACIAEALQAYKPAGITPKSFLYVPIFLMPYILSLPDILFLPVATSFLGMDEQATSSMYEDLKSHRTNTEIDYLQGEIVRLGKELKVATPVCERICDLIRKAVVDGQGIKQHSPDDILDALELL